MCVMSGQYIDASHRGIAVCLMGWNTLLEVKIKLFQPDALKPFVHNRDKVCKLVFNRLTQMPCSRSAIIQDFSVSLTKIQALHSYCVEVYPKN